METTKITPNYTGKLIISGYKLGGTILAVPNKPKWIHRKMMKIFFGLQWVEDAFKQQEQCKCGQPKVGGYSCQRTDCNQTFKQ
jgi:hypothetical protein